MVFANIRSLMLDLRLRRGMDLGFGRGADAALARRGELQHLLGRSMSGYLEKEIQTPLARGRSTSLSR